MTTETMSSGELEKKSMSELVGIYNSVAKKKIKKFSDKETAVRRVIEILSNEQNKAPKEKKPRKKREPKEEGVGSGRHRNLFDFAPKKEIKQHREGTKRALVVALLSTREGATFEEIMTETGWDHRTAREGIALLNKHLGYGIKESENGTIRLIKP